MGLRNISGHLIDTDPEPGFMITVREWDSFIGRVKRLADPLENAKAWAQTCLGIAVALLAGWLALPDMGKHPVRLGLFVSLTVAFAIVAAFFFWLGSVQKKRHPEDCESITTDMERTRNEKAPHAANRASNSPQEA